jgi:predicted metal-dependent hydrolase
MSARPVEIVRRKVDLDFASAGPPPWYPARPASESFLTAISFFFPAGEKFFLDSVAHYQRRITDPVLAEQVRRFAYQEATHSRLHAKCNGVLAAHGSAGRRVASIADFLLWLTRRMPRPWQLAVTCALEHFTAILADGLLRNPDYFLEHARPAFAQMWLWHAVEETEHKGVCFDVYTHAVGAGPLAYLNRVLAMLVTTLLAAAAAAAGTFMIEIGRGNRSAGAGDGPITSLTGAVRKNAFAVMARNIPLRMYLGYFRPSFHPWDHDNADLVARWKARFPDFAPSVD